MTRAVELSANTKELIERFAVLAERTAAARTHALGEIGKHLSGRTVVLIPKRSGRLAGSVSYEVDDDTVRVGYIKSAGGSIPIYAAMREFGGVIRAKNKPYLVFPVGGAAITRAGVGGLSYGDAAQAGIAGKTQWRRVKQVKQKGGKYLTGTFHRERDKVMAYVRAVYDFAKRAAP